MKENNIAPFHSLELRKIKPEEKELLIISREPMVSIVGVAEAKVNKDSGYILVYRHKDQNKNNHLVINKDLYLMLQKIFYQITYLEFGGDIDGEALSD